MEIIPSVFSGVYVCCLRKVTRIDGTVESPPCLKVTQRSFGSQNSNTDIVFYRLSMPIECAEGFTKPAGGTLPANGSFFSPKKDLEDFETVSDFEVLMKTSHGHMSSNGPDKDRDEFNNHKDYNQEKPSKLKQRCVCVCVWNRICMNGLMDGFQCYNGKNTEKGIMITQKYTKRAHYLLSPLIKTADEPFVI